MRFINIFVQPTGRIYYSRSLGSRLMESRVSTPEHETPPELGRLLADWVVRKGSDRILDPAMGTGALLKCVISRLGDLGGQKGGSRVYGIELDPARVRSAADALPEMKGGTHLVASDFLLDRIPIDGGHAFDGIICNP